MTRAALALFALSLLASSVPAAAPAGPVSEEALHFRLEVGVEPGHVVSGWLDESGGTGEGYDSAALDLDGDGEADRRLSFPMVTRGTRRMREVKIPIEHDGATFTFEPYSVAYRRPPVADGAASIHIRWAVTKGDRYCWFINGNVVLHTDPDAARKARPIRLGPPFRFEVSATTRGPEALVRAGLKDSQNSTLRLTREGGKEVRMEVRLERNGEVCLDVPARYG
ncbi:MAG: hypothetical protein GF328_06735 [Candidatus Latescibacteria bacterium]|nr:hypothetical protein [Candidatus Latescibacterota bacterium]